VRRFFMILVLTACCVSGCARFKAEQAAHAELQAADRFFCEKQYSEAVAAYEKVAIEATGTDQGANALFAAAFAQAFYDNPHKDYVQALKYFEEFLRLYPNSEKAPEAQNWRYYLKTVIDLKKENEHLTSSIEQLKKLDIRHEERRRK